MEREQAAGLTAELTAQLRLIEWVYERLNDRESLGLDTPAQLDSIAYQIHNFYRAVEDLLKLVAHASENRIGAGSEWHRTLLLRLSQPVPGIRPAFLSEQTFDGLNRLRGFRHFVRHGYRAEIEVNQLRTNFDLVIQLKALISQDLHLLLEQISPDKA